MTMKVYIVLGRLWFCFWAPVIVVVRVEEVGNYFTVSITCLFKSISEQSGHDPDGSSGL